MPNITMLKANHSKIRTVENPTVWHFGATGTTKTNYLKTIPMSAIDLKNLMPILLKEEATAPSSIT